MQKTNETQPVKLNEDSGDEAAAIAEMEGFGIKPIGLTKSKTESFLGIADVPDTFLIILKPDDEEVLNAFVKIFK